MSEPLKPILVFDSGIGGLSVLRETRVLIPERSYIYVADDVAFPYGAWQEQGLKEHILELFSQLLGKYNPEACIIACNTAFTLVGADLRAQFPAMPFIGTVPAIKPAAEKTYSGMVSVLATPATVQREYTYDLIKTFAAGCEVNLVGAPRLAEIAEHYVRGKPINNNDVWQEIKPCFISQSESKRTDIVVLACTHYPFIVNVLRQLAPWPVDWLNPAHAIAKHARSLIPPDMELLHQLATDKAVFTKGSPDFITQRLMSSFGLQIEDL